MMNRKAKVTMLVFLIVAMILPFSMVDMAQAETTDLQKIKKVIKAYKKALADADTEEDVEQFQKIINRLKIVKQIIIHSNTIPYTGGDLLTK